MPKLDQIQKEKEAAREKRAGASGKDAYSGSGSHSSGCARGPGSRPPSR